VFISVSVTLKEGEELNMDTGDIGTGVLSLLGGNADKDTCSVSVATPPTVIGPVGPEATPQEEESS
jgi:hypothetical protein